MADFIDFRAFPSSSDPTPSPLPLEIQKLLAEQSLIQNKVRPESPKQLANLINIFKQDSRNLQKLNFDSSGNTLPPKPASQSPSGLPLLELLMLLNPKSRQFLLPSAATNAGTEKLSPYVMKYLQNTSPLWGYAGQ